ncbi:MAG: glycoside hydrolase family 127 protein [Chloroflexi bacterium]|nr:glycoside hydrolase family 127 protein [Chloroflexota bacterium]
MSNTQFFPLREIRPAGWLQNFLERQADGLTGNVAVSGYPYGYKFWGTQADNTKGSYAAWWPYEQTAYWIDGALKCGYLAGRDNLYQQALEEVEFAVEHAAEDGFIGPDSLRDKDRWPHAVFFRAVLAQYEITGDRRYLDALVRHYQSTPHPMGWDRDVTGVEILLLLYRETGQADLLEMAENLYARFNEQWPAHDCALDTLLSDKEQSEHGVTFNEEAKLAAMLYTATGKSKYLEAVVHGYKKLEAQARLADGLHSCSEHIHGRTALDLHETCDLTDHTWALFYLLQATDDAHYADTIEQVIFNALPGSITKDFRALQYLSGANQVVATEHSNHNFFMRGLNWMSYRPDHEVQCCPGNLHRAMPNYISRMWLRSADGGVMAALYGPGELQTTVGGKAVQITAQTRYPYQQQIHFTVQPAEALDFAFWLRIPGWCQRASLQVNGQIVQAELKPGSFFKLERTWQPGDSVDLELPFELGLERWPENGVSLTYGPLTLAFPIPTRAEIETENSTTRQRMQTLGNLYEPRPTVVKEDFPAWNLYPAGPWNYALHIDEQSLKDLKVEWNDACADPLDATNPALKLRVQASRVRGWHLIHTQKVRHFGHWTEGTEFCRGMRTIAGDFQFTPSLPDPHKVASRLAAKAEEIELIPYAATLLRVTVFPQA